MKINYEFKTLYAIGILLVISGHFGSQFLSIYKLIPYDSFHMPMFMFASGYFYSPHNVDNIQNVGRQIKKKIYRLVIPYYIWNVFYCFIGYMLNKYTVLNIKSGITDIKSFITEPFLKGLGSGYNCAAWFLIALFLVETIYIFFRFMVRKTKLNNEYMIIFFLLVIAASMIYLSKAGWVNIVSTLIIRTGYLLFWYGTGFFYKVKLEEITRKLNDWLVLMGDFGITVILRLTVEKGQDVRSIIYDAQFSPDVYYVFIRATLGIIFWLRICYIITPYLKNSKIMLYLANHTFSLMMHQGMAGLVINSLVRYIKPEIIDDVRYTTAIWSHFSSRNIVLLIYVVLIPIMILSIIYVYDMCKDKCLKLINYKLEASN